MKIKRIPAAALAWTTLFATTYLGVSMAFTSPLWRNFSTQAWGARFDLWSNLWLIWYFGRCLKTGVWEFSTRLLFMPVGQDLLRTYAHLGLFITCSPFALLLGPTTTYNLFLIGSLVGSGLAMAWLVATITGSRSAAAVAGALFMINPFVLSELAMGSLEMVAMQWIPLALVFLVRLRRDGKWYDGAGLAVSIAVGCLWNWLLGIIILIMVGLYFLWHVGDLASRSWKPAFAARVLAWGLVAGLLLLPFLVPLVRTLSPAGYGSISRADFSFPAQERDQMINRGEVPPLAVTPQDLRSRHAISIIMSSFTIPDLLFHGYSARPVWGAFSLLFLLLALAGGLWAGRKGWFYILLTLLGIVLSLGPYLTTIQGGAELRRAGMSLPFLYFHNYLPLGGFVVRPYRLVILALLGGGVLAGFAVKTLLTRTSSLLRAIVVAGILFLILAEVWTAFPPGAPRPLVDTASAYSLGESSTGQAAGALIELPLDVIPPRTRAGEVVYEQVFHHRPIMNTIFQRNWLVTGMQELATGNSVVAAMLDASGPRPASGWRIRSADLEQLQKWGFEYALVRASFPLHPFYEEGFTWRTQPADMAKEELIELLEGLFGPPTILPPGVLKYDLGNWVAAGKASEFTLTARPIYPLAFVDGFSRGTKMEAGNPIQLEPIPEGSREGVHLLVEPPAPGVQQLVFWSGSREGGRLEVQFKTRNDGINRTWVQECEIYPSTWQRQVIFRPAMAWEGLEQIVLIWRGRQPLRLLGFNLVGGANRGGEGR